MTNRILKRLKLAAIIARWCLVAYSAIALVGVFLIAFPDWVMAPVLFYTHLVKGVLSLFFSDEISAATKTLLALTSVAGTLTRGLLRSDFSPCSSAPKLSVILLSYRGFMFFKTVILTTVILLFSFNVNARHFHAEIDSFRVTCESWGTKKRPTSQSFIWNNQTKKMIVVGDALKEDDGRLIESENTSYKRAINHQIENWDGGKLFKMTFREDYLTRHDRDYHGGGSSEIRTFLFSIPNDISKTSSVEAREFRYIEGILTLGRGGFLFDCQYRKE